MGIHYAASPVALMDATLPCLPRKIIHANPRLLQIAAF